MGCEIRLLDYWHLLVTVLVLIVISSVLLGTCLKELTGHHNIVTSLDYKRVPISSTPSNAMEVDNNTKLATQFVDVIVSVSDDFTARVFTVDIQSMFLNA